MERKIIENEVITGFSEIETLAECIDVGAEKVSWNKVVTAIAILGKVEEETGATENLFVFRGRLLELSIDSFE